MSWDDADFDSSDPWVRFNAHQAAKGRPAMADPDVVRKALKENRPDDPSEEELDELRGLWLSRVMFNPFVGWPPETRTFEEYVEANRPDESVGQEDEAA